MALKRYACHAIPNLRIGGQIKFYLGLFETDKQHLQNMIESNDIYGSGIKRVPTMQEAQAAPAPTIPEMEAAVNAVIAAEDRVAEEDKVDAVETAPPPEEDEWADLSFENIPDPVMPDPLPVQDPEPVTAKITASDLNRMKVADLEVLAAELEVDPGEKRTRYYLQRAIRLKLGV